MHTTEFENSITVELYTREELPPPAVEQSEAIYERLENLTHRDGVEEINQETWVKRTPVQGCTDAVRDTYLAMTEWASNADVALDPFFQTRECYSATEEGWTDWIVLPAICLAIYEDGDLSAVYPHRDGAETRTVADGVQQLERSVLDSAEQSPVVAD